MRRFAFFVLCAFAAVVLVAAPAFGYDEPEYMPESHQGSVLTSCAPCHAPGPSGTLCDSCHPTHGNLSQVAGKGPHGFYSTTTARCSVCHDLHDAGGPQLLPAATVIDCCMTCHDGTGGRGVYGAIEAQTGLDPDVAGGEHSVGVTDVVPGGDPDTGGSATMEFTGEGGTLSCDDCHSPHDANTVTPYTQERWRTTYNPVAANGRKTSKLLRQQPGDSATSVQDYGAAWCAACHQGRMSGGSLHNHPVEDPAVAGAFTYDSLARLDSDELTGITVLGTLAGSNRGFLMPDPRTEGVGGQAGHAPICQQCHEDSRLVGTLWGSQGDADSFAIYSADGVDVTSNPRFQNFPHETVNRRMVVETGDDLCLNCHTTALP